LTLEKHKKTEEFLRLSVKKSSAFSFLISFKYVFFINISLFNVIVNH